MRPWPPFHTPPALIVTSTDAADDANAGLAVLQKLYAALSSITPPPDETLYVFRLSRGRAETATGAPWPPPRPLAVAKDP